jgi:hypothetical protein
MVRAIRFIGKLKWDGGTSLTTGFSVLMYATMASASASARWP